MNLFMRFVFTCLGIYISQELQWGKEKVDWNQIPSFYWQFNKIQFKYADGAYEISSTS